MRLLKTFITAALAAALLALPAGALAKTRDRDHDGMPDKWEKQHHLNVRANDARKDPDKDGLSNIAEFRDHTNPQKADTDGDGIKDGTEVADQTNPTQEDSNHDGVGDAQEISGSIVSLENGLLTIQLPADGAGTVSGTVNDATVIECDDNSTPTTTATASSDGSPDGSSVGGSTEDHSGSGDGPTTTSTPTTSSDDGANHDAADDNSGDSTGSACTSADLKAGARVHEAKLTTATDGSMVFTKIELVPAA